MEAIIFASFYIFSFVVFLMGVHKNSFILSLMGSLLLILFSSVTIALGIQHTEARVITLNYTNPDGVVEDLGTYDVISSGGLNDPYTFSFSLVLGIFSCFFLLYTLLYLRNPPKLPVS